MVSFISVFIKFLFGLFLFWIIFIFYQTKLDHISFFNNNSTSLLVSVQITTNSTNAIFDCLTLSNRTTVITFFQLLENDKKLIADYDFAIVYPDKIRTDNHLENDLCPLITFLQNNSEIHVISGDQLMPWEPICTLEKSNWTVIMKHEYSTFIDGRKTADLITGDLCHSCDLLPDIFVIKLKSLNSTKLLELKTLKKSAHLPFFLMLIGRSAYCPSVKLNYEIKDYNCNNVFSRWDESLSLVPNVHNIFRLINPNNVETWLGCVWMKKAYVLDLPIHCSNFVRQYLFDLVDILENRFKLDYRIVYGSALGALRHKDVIPWSVDADIYPIWPEGQVVDFSFLRTKLYEYSARRYSSLARDLSEHLPPSRVLPVCPVILSSRPNELSQIYNETRNNLIENILQHIEGLSSNKGEWRNFGYVDLYANLEECFRHSFSKPSMVEIKNRKFKTVGNAREGVICQYGNESLYTVPKWTEDDWHNYQDK